VTENPYSPPAEEGRPDALAAPVAGQVHWFSPVQVGICTFFGGPLAGTALLWLNVRAARWQRQTEIFLGLLVLVAVVIISFVLPSNGSVGLGAVGAFSLHSLAKLQLASFLREQPRPHARRGWIQLGVVLAAIAGTLLVAGLAGAILGFVAPGLVRD